MVSVGGGGGTTLGASDGSFASVVAGLATAATCVAGINDSSAASTFGGSDEGDPACGAGPSGAPGLRAIADIEVSAACPADTVCPSCPPGAAGVATAAGSTTPGT
mmetsp:Transcript_60721/g.131602  ORF Transcript_60721/g.131602 Transcript_60721/m.131602 type:complete len:105 (+) Transcript_60721:885-1199(+)